ncbi:hypothetical protein [Pyrolobus fumarii]|uniref:hypothetical protein n=1 Tax=Pyrolobus fumarii TaxID=54252 RepID=UPI00064F583E|nr:hypothetical protein [Pyrolobus fumarii]
MRDVKAFKIAGVLILFLVCLAAILAKPVQANGENGEEEHDYVGGEAWEAEEDEFGEEYAKTMGKIAFYLGLMLNLGFVAVRWARFVVDIPPGIQRLALELHMDGNIVLTIPALWHAYTFAEKAGPVEYGAVTLILLLVASGIVMRYFRGRRAKLVARAVHTQRILALMLLVLLLVHVASAED